MKPPAAARAEAATVVEPPVPEVDLEKVELPTNLKGDIAPLVDDEVAPVSEEPGKLAVKKKPVRAIKKSIDA